MPKPSVRIALVTLISLALIAAVYMTVQGAFAKSDSAGVHAVNGLQTNLNHDRSTVSEQNSLQSQAESQSLYQTGRGHGCEDEAVFSPDD
jgi:hypothetical protein